MRYLSLDVYTEAFFIVKSLLETISSREELEGRVVLTFSSIPENEVVRFSVYVDLLRYSVVSLDYEVEATRSLSESNAEDIRSFALSYSSFARLRSSVETCVDVLEGVTVFTF